MEKGLKKMRAAIGGISIAEKSVNLESIVLLRFSRSGYRGAGNSIPDDAPVTNGRM